MVQYPKAADIVGGCGLKGKRRKPGGVAAVWRGLPDRSCGHRNPQ